MPDVIKAVHIPNEVVVEQCGQLHHITANVNGQIRTVRHDGEDYLVAPVVLLVEGVHNGSGGALFYPAEELATFPAAWNDAPVSIDHPQVNGVPCSCKHPEIIEKQSVGRLYNVEYRDAKLIGELWLNTRKLEKYPEVTHRLTNGMLEVSTGLFSEDEIVSGVWNEETYDAVVHHMRADHLALLVGINGNGGTVGACSVADGCGAPRINASETNTKPTEASVADVVEPVINAEGEVKENKSILKSWTEKFRSIFSSTVKANELSFDGIRMKLSDAVAALDSPMRWHWVYDVYDDYFIYVASPGWEASDGTEVMYKRSYSLDTEKETVTLGDDPQEVVMQIIFKPINNVIAEEETGDETNLEVNSMADQEVKPCCPEKVDALIGNEQTAYQETDKEWLLALNEAQLQKVIDSAEMVKPVENTEEVVEEVVVEDPPVENAESLEEREAREYGARMYQAEKTKLVDKILANTKKFTKADLMGKRFGDLEGMADLIKANDYSAANGAVVPTDNAGAEEPLLPPTYQAGK